MPAQAKALDFSYYTGFSAKLDLCQTFYGGMAESL